jgi:hypothetical protein
MEEDDSRTESEVIDESALLSDESSFYGGHFFPGMHDTILTLFRE